MVVVVSVEAGGFGSGDDVVEADASIGAPFLAGTLSEPTNGEVCWFPVNAGMEGADHAMAGCSLCLLFIALDERRA
jgi:hypothetical protein